MTSHLFIAPTRIGDAVLATSLLRHIAERDPAARITLITSPFAAPLFEGYPPLARLISVVKRSYSRHWLALWRETIGTRWDEVWDLRNSILSRALVARKRHIFIDPKTPEPKVKHYEHVLATGPLPYPILWPREEDTARAEGIMPDGTRYLALAPIANWGQKEWPIEHYIALAHQLFSGPCKDYRPIVICAAHERARALPLLEALAPYRPIDLTDGSAHLLTIYAAMQRAHGFIGNDSGLMHMAAAAGIPTLGLFGPTPSTIYQPWGRQATFLTAPNGDLVQLKPDIVAQTLLSHDGIVAAGP